MTAPIARLSSIVFDCPDPVVLAKFWQTVLGYTHHHSDGDWVTIADPADRARQVAFQRVADFRPPNWPGPERPQQLHLDLLVDDLTIAGEAVRAAGATLLSKVMVEPGDTFRVYADPAGHPFCLIHQAD